jgi:hypothetical protein
MSRAQLLPRYVQGQVGAENFFLVAGVYMALAINNFSQLDYLL